MIHPDYRIRLLPMIFCFIDRPERRSEHDKGGRDERKGKPTFASLDHGKVKRVSCQQQYLIVGWILENPVVFVSFDEPDLIGRDQSVGPSDNALALTCPTSWAGGRRGCWAEHLRWRW